MGLRLFDDGVAIVTGAASGIGRSLSQQLARAGAKVIVADLQIDALSELAEDINRQGGHAEPVKIDVRKFEQLQSLVEQTRTDHGRIDLMFNNAGIAIGGEISQYSADDWDYIIDVHVKGVAYGVQAVAESMVEQGFGHIVNTGSISGLLCAPGVSAYSMTKHAVVGLSKSLRGELRKYGIRVTALCPGAIDTPLLDGGKYGRLHGMTARMARHIVSSFPPMPPDEFVRHALRAIQKNKPLVVLPWQYKMMWQLLKRIPVDVEIRMVSSHIAKRKAEAERAEGDSEAPAQSSVTDLSLSQRTGSM